MQVTEPNSELPPREPLSKAGLVAAIGTVFLINGAILAYAVYSGLPESGMTHQSTAMAATATDGTTPTIPVAQSVNAGVPAVTANIALPGGPQVEALFVQHCAACHGLDGRGRGPAAEQLYPKPRDFVESPFRFASTTGDRDEVIAALERTINQGVPRSAMPGFGGVLTESEIAGLARHVLALREEGGSPAGELHVDIGRHPPLTPALVERGRELYTSLGCVTCHGASGHGDGPGSMGLFDSTNRPVKPGDLASGLYKSGQTPESIARTILAGVPGTPMTPYEQMLIRTAEDGTKDATDLWAIVAYILDLSPRTPAPGIASGAEVEIRSAPDAAMVSDPSHIAWLGIDEMSIGLRPLWQREEATTVVHVRAVRSNGDVAICLDWKDATPDLVRDMGTFPDGVAVMFALGEEVPALPMGVQIEQHEPKEPVNLWHWRADRQYESTRGQRYVAAEIPAGAAQRWFMFKSDSDSNVPARSRDDLAMEYVAAAQEPQSYTAGAVGNPYAETELLSHAALEANALGFGTLTLQPKSEQSTYSTAAWSDGVWRVVLRRSEVTDSANDIQFDHPRRIPIAIAVWNGSKGDRAGVKLVSGWHWLVVGEMHADKESTQ